MDDLLGYLLLPATLLGITAIAAMGLQLILGGAGLLTLGHSAFFALGGYASAAWVLYVAVPAGLTQPQLLLASGLLIGMGTAALAATVVAWPCLRLRGDYLAAATLACGQIAETCANNLDSVGGASGFTQIPRLCGLPSVALCAVVVAAGLWRLYGTGLGQAVLCARDDELVAHCYGIDPARARLAAFVIGSTVTGLAGALSAHAFEFISPTAAGFQRSVELLLAVVVGGMDSLLGSCLGATLLILLPELLRFVPGPAAAFLDWAVALGLPAGVAQVVLAALQNSVLLFALVVLLLLRRQPGGLVALWPARRRRAPA